jgi:hypothetical protein
MIAYSPAEGKKWAAECELEIDFEALEAFHPDVAVQSNFCIRTSAAISKDTLLYRGAPLVQYKSVWHDDRRLRCALMALLSDVRDRLLVETEDVNPRSDKLEAQSNRYTLDMPPSNIPLPENVLLAWRKLHRARCPVENDPIQVLVMKLEFSGFQRGDGTPNCRQLFFHAGSFFEHACYPNCSFKLVNDPETNSVLLEVRSVRDLEANVSCSIMFYRNTIDHPDLRRLFIKQRSGLECKCDSCTLRIRQGPRHYLAETDPSLNLQLYCDNCGHHQNITEKKALCTCARCKTVRYCSRRCQSMHWKAFHKKECVAAADIAPP